MSTTKMNKGALIAEFIGTFGLALAVLASVNGYLDPVPTAVVAGATLGLFVLTIGKISGCHINPAVTLGLLSLKKINLTNSIAYIIAQVAGALTAFVSMTLLLDGGLTAQVSALGDYRVFFGEMLGAMIFGFGIAAAVKSGYEGVNQALAIGGSLALGALFASIVSNGILNPAVAISLESISWSYVLGPIVGMILGMNIYVYAFGKKGKL